MQTGLLFGKKSFGNPNYREISRDRPAAIRVDVRGLTDTSNFETSPIEDNMIPEGTEPDDRDWVFINYTYKRFEGLTQRAQRQTSR